MKAEDFIRLYLEKGSVKKADRAISLIIKNYTSRDIEERVLQSIPSASRTNHIFTTTIQPEIYTGKNPVVKDIVSRFSEAKSAAIVMVLVHGSISTSEEINYSDFDGIILIDESKLTGAGELQQLRKLIAGTEQLMFRQDALQHHGWKVFLRNDFSDYPDAEFPLELLRTGKIIYPAQASPIKVNIVNTHQHYKNSFDSILQSIKKKCRKPPSDLFKFKILCSEIMLLPALFLQAMHNKTHSKKESFDHLKSQFPTIKTELIDQVSTLRHQWKQPEFNFTLSAFHTFRKSGIYLEALAPAIPEEIRKELNPDWYGRVSLLCDHLEDALSKNQKG
ncbi:MAG: hypothetical protein IPM91_11160 [Bacteroidetes bacterium]|nr:hypothetical protein [Bacteroidota bacterium]